MKKCYEWLISIGGGFSHLLLLIIRLYWGFSFFQSGWGKFHHISAVTDYFNSLHIPLPIVSAFLASSAECLGGLCLLVGLASRLVSVPLIFTMLVAYMTAHHQAFQEIFSQPSEFISQAPFNYLLAALIVFSFGPGVFSIDALLKRWVFKRT